MARPLQIPHRVPKSKKLAQQPNTEITQLFQQGLGLHKQGQLTQAKSLYEQVLVKQPQHFDALHLLGVIALQTGKPELAQALIGKAIVIKPNYAPAYSNRGAALKDLKRYEEALASYDKAIAIRPDYAEVFNNRGTALRELNQLDEAIASYEQAIAIQPNYAEAFNNLGNVLKDLQQLEEALVYYDKAVKSKPDYAEAFNNRGITLQLLNRLDEALANFDTAITLKPNFDFLLGLKLHAQMHLCDWRDLTAQLHRLETALVLGLMVTQPFELLGLSNKPALQLKSAKLYAEALFPDSEFLEDFKRRDSSERIRIGYYSADFHNHATAYLMAELFEAHDAQRFELYGFSFGSPKQDEMRQRVSAGFDHFFDVTQKSDREVALMSRALGIDIAVDLKGYTQDSRVGIFAQRCAPVQVNYLGYPGTMGAPYFDYIVADKVLIPPESQQHYSEKVVYLPHSYQVNDAKRKIADTVFTRKALGLPESGFVFCCFNNNYKILPTTFDAWMRLLKAVDGSVLWLLETNTSAAHNLRQEAQVRGVEPSRLVFAKRMKLEDHLARHRAADLFLDTLPYNAHTTTSDALWAGLPVLTLMGQTFAARVAASLLTAMDLPELITHTQEDYEAKALELAQNPLQLARLKDKLERNRATSTLFNGQLFARHLEAAYAQMHKRHLSGERPEIIEVQALMR